MSTRTRISIVAALGAAAAAVMAVALTAGSGAGEDRPAERLPRGDERVELDPADFSTRITNPWWPMTPGSRWVYRETDSEGQAGVIMPAHPRPGLRYRQEHYEGHAEDRGSIVSLREQAEVPFGHFRPVLMTRDENPLEPKVLEFKFYARGVGPVLAVRRVGRQRPRGAGPLPPARMIS
ncbi:MAG: hypothetical protein ACRDL4_01590 [Thermoleophilaceae bacterium]